MKLQNTLFVAGASALGAQKPLHYATTRDGGSTPAATSASSVAAVVGGAPPWSLNFSSPAPHFFASAHALLQQWANTIFPNGHSIALVEVPAFTMLYHGRLDGDTPPSPEWLSMDVEMAYGIMGSTQTSHLLTFQTQRPVKCLYFDGESATLMGSGKMDTQMLHIYGNVSGPPGAGGPWDVLGAEYRRAVGLCDWIAEQKLGGRGWGVEGVVRMNAGFEVIWCDFLSDSLQLMSKLDVSAPPQGPVDEAEPGAHEAAQQAPATPQPDDVQRYYPIPPQPTRTDRSAEPTGNMPPPNWRSDTDEPFLASQSWGWFLSATYHYGSTRRSSGRGEERLRLRGCGIASYYAPPLAVPGRDQDEARRLNLTADGVWSGSGAEDWENGLTQLRRRRRAHTLGNATAQDAQTVRSWVEQVVRRSDGECSGADWGLVIREIVQRTAGHLQALETTLSEVPAETANATAVTAWMRELRGLSHLYMVPFLEYPKTPGAGDGAWSTQSDTYQAAFHRCKYHYTRRLVGRDLVTEEAHMRWAVEETMGSICSVLLRVGFAIESAALARDRHASAMPAQALRWRQAVAELRAWLGWEGEYLDCEEQCAWDERCYIPMWPMVHFDMPKMPGGGKPSKGKPGDGHGRPGPPPGEGPGGGHGGHHGGPGKDWNEVFEQSLWTPKCIKAAYLYGG